MRRYLLIIIATLTALPIFAADADLNFFLVSEGSGSMSNILYFRNPDIYALSDPSNGILSHHMGDTVRTYPPPHRKKARDYGHIWINDSSHISIISDNDFHTFFYRWNGSTYIPCRDSAEVPVRNGFTYKGRIYLYGDWGRLFILQDDTLSAVPHPVENHFIDHLVSGDRIWFSVRHEGIWSFENDRFTRHHMPDYNDIDIGKLAEGNNGRIYALARDGRIYRQENDGFRLYHIPVEINGYSAFAIRSGSDDTLYFSEQNSKLMEVSETHRSSISLPADEMIRDIHVAPDGTMLLMGEDGVLIMGKYSEFAPFHNRAFAWNSEGLHKGIERGAAFFYANNDRMPDLFVMNANSREHNYLYMNRKGESFVDAAYQSGLSSFSQEIIYHITDSDKDGNSDILTVGRSMANTEVKMLRGNGDGKFLQIGSENVTKEMGNLVRDIRSIPADGGMKQVLACYYADGMNRGNLLTLLTGRTAKQMKVSPWDQPSKWYSTLANLPSRTDEPPLLYVGTYWGKDRLVDLTDGSYSELYPSRAMDINTHSAFRLDADRDLRHDLLLLSIENPPMLILDDPGKHNDSLLMSFNASVSDAQITSAAVLDYDNDGWQDVFLCGSDRNYLLKNVAGNNFKDIAADLQLITPPVKFAITADVDRDGQIDIYGMKDGINLLWINQSKNNRFIDILVQSAWSARQAYWISASLYQAGSDSCLAVEYSGAGHGHVNFFNSPNLHFGLNSPGPFDIKLRFPNGKTRILHNVNAGSMLTVNENGPLRSALDRIAALVLHSAADPRTYIWLFVLIAFASSLFLGLRLGTRHFSWSQFTVYIHITSANVLFWLSILLSRDLPMPIRYMLPLALNLVNFLLAYFFSWQQLRTLKKKHKKDNNFLLLQELLVFSHGDWAMSTVNGLSMLCQAMDRKIAGSELIHQFESRKKSYLNALSIRLEKLLQLAREIPELTETTDHLSDLHGKIQNTLQKDDLQNIQYKELAANLDLLKKYLRQLKNIQYQNFSSDLASMLPQIISLRAQSFDKRNFKYTIEHDLKSPLPVLMPAEMLSDILDNLFQNAERAMKDSREPLLQITSKHVGSRIELDFCDNGCGIDQTLWEKIFESGISLSGSSGSGLAVSRKKLTDFGAKIYVRNSRPGAGTCFHIEFKEGIL